jgi:hypothetical protein
VLTDHFNGVEDIVKNNGGFITIRNKINESMRPVINEINNRIN